MDTRTQEQRSQIMRAVRSKNTGPELKVRRVLHKLGYRFRIHRQDLPGTPDVVLPKYRTAIFVHGCYWHGHGCAKGKLPKSNGEFWLQKINRNIQRDRETITRLRELGWNVEVIWTCDLDASTLRLIGRLENKGLDSEFIVR